MLLFRILFAKCRKICVAANWSYAFFVRSFGYALFYSRKDIDRKKLFCILTCICVLVALCVMTASAKTYSGTCGTNVTWSLDTSTGLLEISGSGDMADYSFSSAPWHSYCGRIKTVTIGDSVTSIGEYAFYDCSSLESITIPDSVTSIGISAFYECSGLTSITIPDSVTSIGDRAFHSCCSLTSITVDNNNTAYSSDEYGVLFNKDKTMLIQYPKGNTRSAYTIPDSVTSIGARAFYECSGLTSITIPDSVTSSGEDAF